MSTTQVPLLSLALPCLNERQAIPDFMISLRDTQEAFASRNEPIEVIVVDDGSTDGSCELLRSYPGITVIENTGHHGYGGALKAGFARARGQWIAFMDLDRTYRPEDLPRLLDLAISRNADIVYGCRSMTDSGMPRIRALGNAFFVLLSRLLLGGRVRDVCSGFRIFHRQRLPSVLSLSRNGLDFSMQLSLVVIRERWRIEQAKIDYDERLGCSKLSVVQDGCRFLGVIIFWRLRQFVGLAPFKKPISVPKP